MKVITRDLPDDYFTANRFRPGDELRLKYFCAVDRHGNEIFVIWGPGLAYQFHKDKFEYFGFTNAISAGYINYEPELGFYCFGESTTLHVRSRKKEDTAILQNWIATRSVSRSARIAGDAE